MAVDWRAELEAQVANRVFQRGELTPFLRRFAQEHGTTLARVSKAYYSATKQERSKTSKRSPATVGPPKDSAVAPKEKPSVSTKTLPYEIGELVTGKVTGIQPYGVFLTLEDGVSGLIHITKVAANNPRPILATHFRMGDTIQARVQTIEDNKLSLSTVDMDLPDYSETAKKSRDMDDVMEFAKKLVDDISDEAMDIFARMLAQYGPVRVAMALYRVSGSFHADPSVLLARHVELELNDGL